ncbi:hypothetical protein EDD17DRAFT_1557490 [Pisolithus thermaeus]|nr:hypothetical protein EDD17DRAFT_1557490 [Pisolithus thermaeus]
MLSTTTNTAQLPAKSQEPHPPKVLPKHAHRGQDQAAEKGLVQMRTSARLPAVPPKRPPPQDQLFTKKVQQRSGKPIINWFQRKLAGTVRPRRVRDEDSLMMSGQKPPGTNSQRHLSVSAAFGPNGRSVSSTLPHGTIPPSQKHGIGMNKRGVAPTIPYRRTISLNDVETDNAVTFSNDEDNIDAVTRCSSLARDSMWSPASALEADEDASMRPLPPSTPPSPSPSYSSSSYMSNSRTFRSIAASTKPTTVLSIDLPPAGIGHIAQVPPTPTQIAPRHGPHTRSSSVGINNGASITFSTPLFSSQPQASPGTNASLGTSPSTTAHGTTFNGLQPPLHTAHHPRNNPRPWSPPPDNASVLTLASSTFAISGARMTMGSIGSTVLSGLVGGGDSISHLGGSVASDPEGENTSQLLGDDDRLEVDGERDVDASVRALRPRSSRRCSWESEVSGWSAKVLGAGAGISTGSKSLWTSYSLKTGELIGGENEENERDEKDNETEEVGESLRQEPSTRKDRVSVNTPERAGGERVGEASADIGLTSERAAGQSLVQASAEPPAIRK